MIDEETARFCREDVALPWNEALRVYRGERTTGWLRPFLGFGPNIPAALLPFLTPPVAVRFVFGRHANLATVVLNRTRNQIVFLALERAENGRYLEMVRLDEELAADAVERVLRLVQAGAEGDALRFLGDELEERGLGRFRPDIMKVADLHFFDAFAELAALQRGGRRQEWARESLHVARRVLRERLVYFYPAVRFERMLALGRRWA